MTTDPVAAHPGSVRLAWNGQVAAAATVPGAVPATVPGAVPATKKPPSSGPGTPDPTTNGRYGIARADYDFGDSALTLSGLGGRVVEERAAVWVPVGAQGRRPVVLFLHGRHSACDNPTTRATDNAPLLHLTWSTPTTVTVTPPSGGVGARRYDALTLRAALDDTNAPADLTLTVIDGAGRRQSTTVSALGDALSVMPGTGTTLLPKTWLQTVRWPVAAIDRVNTHDIRRVLVSGATATGGVYLSDVAFQASAVGAGGPSRLPQVSIVGTTVDEGDGPGTATVHLELSRPSPVPVVADVQVLAGTGAQVVTGARRVVIPPGRRTVAVSVPIVGNTTPATTVDTVYKVFVLDPTNAVVGQDFAHLTVHDDDPAPAPAA